MKDTIIRNYFCLESLIHLDLFHELMERKQLSRMYSNFGAIIVKKRSDETIVIENIDKYREIVFSPIENDWKQNELGEMILLNYLTKIKNFDLISRMLNHEEIKKTDINKMIISFECKDEKAFLKNKLKISKLDRMYKTFSKIEKQNGLMTLKNPELKTNQLIDYVTAIKNNK